jgi:two-component system, LytTR family, response regulator
MSRRSPSGPWRAIVVDDEPLARQSLRLLLAREDDFVIVAECGHGAEGVDAIHRERPDVLFLDVQMPELDGFDMLNQLGRETAPAIVFVTAFDRYALRAFDHHALDYLLKPFSDERFSLVIERTRVRLWEHAVASIATLPAAPSAMAARPREFVVRDGGRRIVVRHTDIMWIEAEDYYVRLHLRDRTLLVRESLHAMAKALSNEFVRVHRSAIARVACIRAIEPVSSGDQRLTLEDGTVLKVSRTHRAGVVNAFAKHVR